MATYVRHIISCLVFGIFLTLVSPTIFWGDGGFLTAASYTLGIPHPTGHPLFAMLGKIITFLPVGNIAFKLNLLGPIFCILSFYAVIWAVTNLLALLYEIKDDQSANLVFMIALVVALNIILSPMMTDQARYVETYALNLFISMLVTASILKAESLFQKHRSGVAARYIFLGIFLLALGFGNHSLLIMCLAPGIGLYLAFRTLRSKRTGIVFPILFFILLGVSVYLYLPLRAIAEPAVNLGNPQTKENFLWVFTAEQFRENTFSLLAFIVNFSLKNLVFTTKATVKTFFSNLHYVWLIFSFLGAAILFYKRRLIFFIFLLLGGLSILITYPPTFVTKIPLEERGVVGYYLYPLSLLFLTTSLPVYRFLIYIKNNGKKTFLVLAYILAVFLLLFPLFYFSADFKSEEKARNYSAYMYGRTYLGSLEYGSLYLGITDAGIFIPLYMQVSEKYRSDTDIVNRSMFFNEKGFDLLKTEKRELFNDEKFYSKDKLRINEFALWLKSKAHDRHIYFETGNKFMIKNASFYPRVLLLGLGKSDMNRLVEHDRKTSRLFSYLKNEDFIKRRNSIINYNIAAYNIGNYFLKEKDFDRAVFQYSFVLSLNPLMKEASFNLLSAYLGASRYDKAVSLAEELLKKYDDPQLYYNYALALAYSGEIKRAIKVLQAGGKRIGYYSMFKGLLNKLLGKNKPE